MKLDGKVAIVTGAGSIGEGIGIGKAISITLAREGAKVALVDKSQERADETLRLIKDDGGDAVVLPIDLTQPSSAQQIVDETVARYGGVDILVNNAAAARSIGILETPVELYEEMVAVNVTAPFALCKAAIPIMIERGGGAIVNISSISALRGQGGANTAYATTKASMLGLTIDLADAFGTNGIRVNCIAPGIINTPQRAAVIRAGGHDPADFDLSQKTSLGIEGDAWDVARAVLFLAGPDGRYVTGVLLPVDGGVTARSH